MPEPRSTHITRIEHRVPTSMREARNQHIGGILWFTGLSGAGKSTLAFALEERLFREGFQVYVLDGDNVRHGLNADLGFSPADRTENVRRVGEVAAMFADAGFICITAFISPYREDRDAVRKAAKDRFHEVYIRADLATCEQRDPKDLYKKARAGTIANFTAIHDTYEAPDNPSLVVDTNTNSVEESLAMLMEYTMSNFVVAKCRSQVQKKIRKHRHPVLFEPTGPLYSNPFLNIKELFQCIGNNAGNLAFYYAIKHHIAGWGEHASLPWTATPERVRNSGDVGIIPCANQFGRHHDLGRMAERLEKIEIPLVAVGLGAQSNIDFRIPEVPDGTVRWLRAIADRAPTQSGNIAVRGEYTRKVLEEYGFKEAYVTGCPSLYINPSTTLGQQVKTSFSMHPGRIAVAAGHPGWRHLSRIEQSLTRMVTATSGAYVCQSPIEMVMLGRGEIDAVDPVALEQCRKYIDAELSMEEFKAWVMRHAKIFIDIPSWLGFLRPFDFVVGTRIHGVALGLQAGVPALCIAHDSRTLELCQTMKIPYVLAKEHSKGLELGDLPRMFQEQFDADLFDMNRRTLAKEYCRFLEENSLALAPSLMKLAS